MKYFYFLLFTFYFLLFSGCRPAAAPVSVSDRPISINNVPQTNLPLPPGKNIENLGWTLFDGQTQRLGDYKKLGDYKGKVVVLDFWATYCKPCLEEIPHLVELQNKYADLRVIGLHVGGEEDVPRVPEFVERLKINYVLAYPEDELNKVLLDGSAIPQTFVFDRNGKLIEKFVGYDLKVKSDLDKAITQALN
ncbi:MAG TPA: TlpA disulfide reductase family protein [Pyrinomonadaceae bacterium]|nr:TlpA disulfide reductase family protein [Pyrinomonadaceae bacterium]